MSSVIEASFLIGTVTSHAGTDELGSALDGTLSVMLLIAFSGITRMTSESRPRNCPPLDENCLQNCQVSQKTGGEMTLSDGHKISQIIKRHHEYVSSTQSITTFICMLLLAGKGETIL